MKQKLVLFLFLLLIALNECYERNLTNNKRLGIPNVLIQTMKICGCVRKKRIPHNYPFEETVEKESIRKQIHIAIGDDLSEMVIIWNERIPTNKTAVIYGLQNGEYSHIETSYSTVLKNKNNIQYIHYVTLKNLEPNVRYKYRVGSPHSWSKEHNFKTVRNDYNWVPRVCIFDDYGWPDGYSIPSLIDMGNKEAFDLVFHNGDIAYNLLSNNGIIGDGFMKAIEPLASKVPYIMVPGNHEYWDDIFNLESISDLGYNYKRRFKMPQNTENEFYTFKIGKALFVVFSTKYYFTIENGSNAKVHQQNVWLEQVLTEANKPENRAEQPWIIGLGHRTLYCSVIGPDCINGMTIISEDTESKTLELEEILYRQGVDVAFWGHLHYYKRLLPVYNRSICKSSNPYINPFSTVHIIRGSAGLNYSQQMLSYPAPPWSAFRSLAFGYTIINIVNETHLYLKQIDINSPNRPLDSVWIVQQNYKTRDIDDLFNADIYKQNLV